MTRVPNNFEEYLTANQATLVESIEQLLSFDTHNPPGRTTNIVGWIENYLEQTTATVERIAVDPDKPNLLVTLPGESDVTLGYNGHLDTVPYTAHDWTYNPLGERIDDRVYGRGATDMKGAVAAMLQVITAFTETETTPPVTLQFAFVSDEETGGDAGLTTMLDTDSFNPNACVVGETTSRAGRYSVSVADRGNIWLTLDATGTAAHGSRPMIGSNAIDRLTGAIEHLRTDFGEQELTLDPAMHDIIAESIDFYELEAGADATRELYYYPTINLGVFEGGTAINTVPASACARIDIRLTAGVETRAALQSIRSCLNEMAHVEITDLSWTQGTYEPLDSPIVTASTRAAEHVVNDPVYRRSATGGGDAKVLRHNDIPTVEFGFGTQTAHATDEYTTTEALSRNATAYTHLPYEYATARTQA